MKCKNCGKETGASWKKLCYDCHKQEAKEQEDNNYLNAIRAGNVQNDLCFAEDNVVI